MKNKLIYSLLLSLVVLISFDLAFAQNPEVYIVGPTQDLCPNTPYCYEVWLSDGAGIVTFTLPIIIASDQYLDGSAIVDPILPGLLVNDLGIRVDGDDHADDSLKLGYNGPDLGPGPHLLAIICITTSNTCGESFTIDTGFMAPHPPSCGHGLPPYRFAGPRNNPNQFAGDYVAVDFTPLTAMCYDGDPECGDNPDEFLACCDSIINKQINATDLCGIVSYTQTSGRGNTDAQTGIYNYFPDCTECDFVDTVCVRVTNVCGNTVDCCFVIYYDQDAPEFTQCWSNKSEHWNQGDIVYSDFAVVDDDCPTPHTLTYSIVDVDPALVDISINSTTGDITFDPHCDDIAGSPHTVTVKVDDDCEFDLCEFDITVTNERPWIICPNDTMWQCCVGPLFLGDVPNGDPDGDQLEVRIDTLVYINGVYPGHPPWCLSMNPDGTDLVLDCCPFKEGLVQFFLIVDDGCWTDTCTFFVQLYGWYEISLLGGSCAEVLPGYNATVNVSIDTGHVPIGGFDLLISYDAGGGINFLSAKTLGDLEDYWEYFTYRYSQQDNCGGGCPSGYIRLVGIYDMPNGMAPGGINLEGDFVELTFQTTEDRSFLGQCFWLDWAWFDCGDNTLSSITGDTLYIAIDTVGWGPLHEFVDGGWCLDPDKGVVPIPCVVFRRGCICLIPPEDDRGDINLNGIANEISDAVLYANYFIYGPGVLGYPADPYYENRVLASDINDDGIVLTVADLVYLIRIITGDANPFPESGEGDYKITPTTNTAQVSYVIGDDMVVRGYAPVDVGAAAFVFRHTGCEVGLPVASDAATHMTIGSSDENGELRVLVYSMDNNSIAAGAYDLFTVPLSGEGTLEMVEVQFSDSKGNVLATTTAKVAPPTAYALMQNYPNPFNAGTAIRFALPMASDWDLRIFNVAGQLVKEFKGYDEAGLINVHWDAKDIASGIYFYKLQTRNFTDTKKMILMK